MGSLCGMTSVSLAPPTEAGFFQRNRNRLLAALYDGTVFGTGMQFVTLEAVHLFSHAFTSRFNWHEKTPR